MELIFDIEIANRRISAVQTGPTDFEIYRFEQFGGFGLAEPVGVSLVGGVPRWTSNNQVPPPEAITSNGLTLLPGFNEAATTAARNFDIDQFLSEYVEYHRTHQITVEEDFELQAAFGENTTVINAITGQVYKTGRSSRA